MARGLLYLEHAKTAISAAAYNLGKVYSSNEWELSVPSVNVPGVVPEAERAAQNFYLAARRNHQLAKVAFAEMILLRLARPPTQVEVTETVSSSNPAELVEDRSDAAGEEALQYAAELLKPIYDFRAKGWRAPIVPHSPIRRLVETKVFNAERKKNNTIFTQGTLYPLFK